MNEETLTGHNFNPIKNQMTIGPVPLTWVLRICENQQLLRKKVIIELLNLSDLD